MEISHKSDSPDPRVGGTKIIFDSRFDKITEQSKTADLDAFIKAKQEKSHRPKTELEIQKETLQRLMEEERQKEKV